MWYVQVRVTIHVRTQILSPLQPRRSLLRFVKFWAFLVSTPSARLLPLACHARGHRSDATRCKKKNTIGRGNHTCPVFSSLLQQHPFLEYRRLQIINTESPSPSPFVAAAIVAIFKLRRPTVAVTATGSKNPFTLPPPKFCRRCSHRMSSNVIQRRAYAFALCIPSSPCSPLR